MSTTQTDEMGFSARTADEELLASLGYKQEFRREFTGVEVCTHLLYFAILCMRGTGFLLHTRLTSPREPYVCETLWNLLLAHPHSSKIIPLTCPTDVWHCIFNHWPTTLDSVSQLWSNTTAGHVLLFPSTDYCSSTDQCYSSLSLTEGPHR